MRNSPKESLKKFYFFNFEKKYQGTKAVVKAIIYFNVLRAISWKTFLVKNLKCIIQCPSLTAEEAEVSYSKTSIF